MNNKQTDGKVGVGCRRCTGMPPEKWAAVFHLKKKNNNKRLTFQKILRSSLHQQLIWNRSHSGKHFCKLILNNYTLTDHCKKFQQHWRRWTCFLCACQKYFQGWDPKDLWERLGPNQADFDLLENEVVVWGNLSFFLKTCKSLKTCSLSLLSLRLSMKLKWFKKIFF